MAAQTQQSQWQRVRNIHREWARFYELAGGGSVFIILGLLGLLIFASDRLSYSMNTYTELLSVTLTILVLDRRAKHREERERKEELIFQMGSEDNSTALGAARMLRHKGWLQDGSLQGARLWGANLEGADLGRANLQGANLRSGNLNGADLLSANLQSADLMWANLRDADLGLANLEGTDLTFANLQGADLTSANLRDADLGLANLQGADLASANLRDADLSVTKLPDGTFGTPETDMTRFTDPEHPEFWTPPKR